MTDRPDEARPDDAAVIQRALDRVREAYVWREHPTTPGVRDITTFKVDAVAALGRLVAERDEARQRGDDLYACFVRCSELRQEAVAERDAWKSVAEAHERYTTLPSGEGAAELAKARRGVGLDAWEMLAALRAAMEVADRAKERGMAAVASRKQAREDVAHWRKIVHDQIRGD